MTLQEHARRELTLTGEDPDVIDWYCRVIKEFASFGHSGGSAAATIPVLHELLQYHPLTDLTSDPAEWMDRTAESGRPMWQNIRDSRVFSEDGGKTYWYVSDNPGADGKIQMHRAQAGTPHHLVTFDAE